MFNTAYQLGAIRIEPSLVLAPMSGVTCSAFRRLIKELNPNAVGLMVTEFISVEALSRNISRSLDMMEFRAEERPLAIQIFGYDIDRIVVGAQMAQDAGADIVDLNCGCPAPKVVRRGGGCELMRQPSHLQQILKALRAAVKIPLTMKFRAGWDDKNKNALEIAKMAEGEGLDAVAVHGRTREQLYRGLADWEVAAAIKSAIKIPVIGSGDVVDIESAKKASSYGVDGLMIGRGAIANPFIFRSLVDGEDCKPTINQQLDIISSYYDYLKEDFPPVAIIGKIKQLASQMCTKTLRKAICTTKDLIEMERILVEARSGLHKGERSL